MGDLIPVLEGFMEDCQFESLSFKRFLYKAAIGSAKAIEWSYDAERSVIFKLTKNPTLENELIEEYYKPLLEELSKYDLRNNPSEIIMHLEYKGWIKHGFTINDSPFYSINYYNSLWKHGKKVSEQALLHDSIINLAQNWSNSDYLQREKSINEDRLNYNSVDAITRMLYISFTLPKPE